MLYHRIMEENNSKNQEQLVDLVFAPSNEISDELLTEKSTDVFEKDSISPSSLEIDDSIDFSLPFNHVLFAVNRVICSRLDKFESRLDSMAEMCETLHQKMKTLSELVPNFNSHETYNFDKSKVELNPAEEIFYERYGRFGADSSGLHCLNHEKDYPNGSWLGDENKPEMRVRCPIPIRDLFLINKSAIVPEKMALTLLDNLFDKQVLATSNISGTGKHNKKRLDPLMICGIWCHLNHLFDITDEQWHRIKQNLDSKCRSAFRNKRKLEQSKNVVKRQNTNSELSGLNQHNTDGSLSTVTTNSQNLLLELNGESSSSNSCSNSSLTSDDLISNHLNAEVSLSVIDDKDLVPTQIIPDRDLIEVFQATPEQIAKIKESGYILLNEENTEESK